MAKAPTRPRGPMQVSYTGKPIPVSIGGVVRTAESRVLSAPRQNNVQSRYDMQGSPDAEIYDYLDWGAAGVGSTQYRFFSRSVSGTVTTEQTNMQTPNMIGQGNSFKVFGIELFPILGVDYVTAGAEAALAAANALDDFKAIYNRGVFQFYVNNIPVIGNGIAPCGRMISDRMPVSTSAALSQTGAATGLIATSPNGWGGYDCSMAPFDLNDNTPFYADLTFPSGAVTLPSLNGTTKIGCILKGVYYRPTS